MNHSTCIPNHSTCISNYSTCISTCIWICHALIGSLMYWHIETQKEKMNAILHTACFLMEKSLSLFQLTICQHWLTWSIGAEKNNCLKPWYHSLLIHIHYSDVIMGVIASQITSLTIVYSTVYSDADQRKHQSSASLTFVWGIHRGPVNSLHKWPAMRKMFPFDDVIMHMCVTLPQWVKGLISMVWCKIIFSSLN